MLSEPELYLQEYYTDEIKSLIEAEKHAGNLSSHAEVLNAGCQLSKELLDATEPNIKDKIKTMYNLQKKKQKEKESDEAQDPVAIQQ